MRLSSFQYSENIGSSQEWVLDKLTLNSKNLIVGKNAVGKSRTLNVIIALANSLSRVQPILFSGNYNCIFMHEGKEYSYQLIFEQEQIYFEKLMIDGEIQLEKNKDGINKIRVENIKEVEFMNFQPPPTEISAFSRRDSLQHSFLEPLYLWASSVIHHQFGTTLGKGTLSIIQPGAPAVDEKNQAAIAGIYRKAEKEFDDDFNNAIIQDMAKIGYHINRVGLCPPISIKYEMVPSMTNELVVLYVQENDLPGITDQISMSQGMFRILSLLIQVNYFRLKNIPTCILIDDIGEGLDFDRSCRIIKLLRDKTNGTDLQLIMSTNDRFVMNDVPLEEWSVLQRKGSHVRVSNYLNSKEIFEEFKFTGLSNFSFLEFDVLNEQSNTEDSPGA